jgi:UDP-N-acetylglucosamine 2-epimerase (non-hydrolysing)
MTAHRRESFGGPLIQIFEAVREIADANPDVHIVYPVHPNPNVSETADLILGNHDRIDLIGPQDYLSFIYLMEKSYLIMTDSGGIQEEAPSLGKPVLVYRNVTERNEAIEAGTVKLVGTRKEDIVEATQLLLDDEEEYRRMARAINPYGDGHAAEQIVSIILENYSRYVI